MMKRIALLACSAFLATGCMTAAEHRADVQDDSMDRVSVGVVQREISVGMTGAQVTEVLGAPNIVSTDETRNEVWIYDKIATDVAYSRSAGGISGLLFGTGDAHGFGGGFTRRSAGAQSSSQRTLTVVIKFDADDQVRDFSYHSSSF